MVVSPPVASPVGSPVAAPAPGTVEVKEEAKPEEGKCPSPMILWENWERDGRNWEELGGTTCFFFGEIIVNTEDWVLACKFCFTFLRIPASSFEDVSNRTPLFCALADASTKKPPGSHHAEVVAGSWRRCA